ncbi:hypothetical protein ACROAE_09985 [Shewanella sp. MF05960]|uniref:hypothetical protein n=1 Tax=Shewanella sp. MF05960 TaxID=3434874 RepID=UPI003D7B3374
MKNILFISSPGGHWIQLLRIAGNLSCENCDIAISSTYEKFESKFKYFNINDFNRNNFIFGIINIIPKLIKIKSEFSPNLVITTGAAPGLIALIFFKMFNVKVLWIDSLANSEKVSMSARVAQLFSITVLTQWDLLETNKIKYKGRVL